MATGTTIFQWLPMGVALLAGAAVPLQGASNAALGRALGHPLWATMVSLVVSMLVVLPLMGSMRVQAPRLLHRPPTKAGFGPVFAGPISAQGRGAFRPSVPDLRRGAGR